MGRGIFVSCDAVDPPKSWILEYLNKIKPEATAKSSWGEFYFHSSLKIQGITALSTTPQWTFHNFSWEVKWTIHSGKVLEFFCRSTNGAWTKQQCQGTSFLWKGKRRKNLDFALYPLIPCSRFGFNSRFDKGWKIEFWFYLHLDFLAGWSGNVNILCLLDKQFLGA